VDGLAEVVGETGLVLEVVDGTKGEAGLVVLAEAPVALLVALGVVVPFAADPEAPAVLFPGLADTVPVVALGGPEDGGLDMEVNASAFKSDRHALSLVYGHSRGSTTGGGGSGGGGGAAGLQAATVAVRLHMSCPKLESPSSSYPSCSKRVS
jgi:uncharacterized membrane protein YgcG